MRKAPKSFLWSSFSFSFFTGLQHWIPALPSPRKLLCLTGLKINQYWQIGLCLLPHYADLSLGPTVHWGLPLFLAGPLQGRDTAQQLTRPELRRQNSGPPGHRASRRSGSCKKAASGLNPWLLPCELGSWDRGAGVVTDTHKRATSGEGLENKKKGETPPNTQGLKPPKAQGWWESSTTGAPRRPREQRGALGEGRGARGRFPAPADQHSC